MGAKLTTEQFITKAKEVHGDKYDYSKTVYVGSGKNVTITCSEHGDIEQRADSHLKGFSPRINITTEQFITKAKEVHGDKYDYSKTVYVNAETKVIITCSEHGDFEQIPNVHLSGRIRHQERRLTTEQFITKAKDVHGDNYDYSKTVYVKNDVKVIITCSEHGDFEQVANGHLDGKGCCECRGTVTLTTEQFITKAKEVHGDKYDYSKTVYVNGNSKLIITCPTHGDFEQRASVHYLHGCACPKCGTTLSKNEDYIVQVLREMGETVIQSDRTIIKPKELDIYLPEHKLAIEYNGMKWHTEQFRSDKDYHLNKTKLCKNKGIKLIHIWEDEFVKNPEAHIEMITRLITPKNNKRVNPLVISDKKHVKDILNKHHIKGSCNFTTVIGLYQKGELQTITCFTKRDGGYFISRHLNMGNINNSLSKTIKFFNEPNISAMCDLSVDDTGEYEKSGFKVVSNIKPDYKYVVKSERHNKWNWQKKTVKEMLPFFFDEDLTLKEMLSNSGIFRIWDCGHTKLST